MTQWYKTEFSDVDRAADPEKYVKCLDAQIQVDEIERLKQRAIELLDVQAGHSVLDAGCGTGRDALAMLERVGDIGHVMGIDSSATMIAEATKRAEGHQQVSFRQADIHQLDLISDSFDRCLALKTFQHLSEPREALRELVRVTKPGGKIVIGEPDHELVTIATPYTDVNRRFIQFRSDSLKQGGIAHQLYGLFKEFGLVDVSIELLPTIYTDYELRKCVAPYLDEIRVAERVGVVTREEADTWNAYLEEAIRNGRYLSTGMNIITAGYKPRS